MSKIWYCPSLIIQWKMSDCWAADIKAIILFMFDLVEFLNEEKWNSLWWVKHHSHCLCCCSSGTNPSVWFDRGTAGQQAYVSFLSDVLRHCKPEGGGEALFRPMFQTSLIGILVGRRLPLMVRIGWGSLDCNGMRFARYDNHLWKYQGFSCIRVLYNLIPYLFIWKYFS